MSTRTVLAVLWIASAVGCREDEMSELTTVRDEVCACKTVECGDAAMKRVPIVAGAGNRRSQVIARAMLDCLAKLYEKERPLAGPDLEEPLPEETGSGSAAAPTVP